MPNLGRFAIGILLLAGLGAGLVHTAFRSGGANAQHSETVGEPAIKVALAKAIARPYTYYLENIGKLEATQQTFLSAEIGGRVAQIDFDSGKVVKQGDVLLRINDEPERADLIRLRGQLATAQAQWDRLQELVKKGAESRSSYDDARAKYEAARGELERTVATINQKTIKAPFDGSLGIRLVHLGQYLQAGTPIATLTGREGIRVNFTASEGDFAKLRVGRPVQVVTDSYPDKVFEGEVNAIDPQLNDSHIVAAQALIKDPDGWLRPGMYARVRVAVAQSDEITIPESAITYNSYGETVFRLYRDAKDRTRVKRINVKVGERREGLVVVSAGLKSGDSVVTSGQVRLSDDVLVDEVADTISPEVAARAER